MVPLTRSTTDFADALATFAFSLLSVCGSSLVLLSYYSYHAVLSKSKETNLLLITEKSENSTTLSNALSSIDLVNRRQNQSTEKNYSRAAYLIFHLAISDLIWFLSALLQSAFWLFGENGSLPVALCFICSPLIIFTRISSLMWTCIISYNVLRNVNKRYRSRRKAEAPPADSRTRLRYCLGVFAVAIPGAVLNIAKKCEKGAATDLGCKPGYEALGFWYVFVFAALPIFVGFCINVFVFCQVRSRMSKKVFPQSVRKRRKRIMYHYVIVCILCWAPTIFTYLLEICGVHSPVMEILARASLYSSGFFNFLVFGMQDPHLQRSLLLICYRCRHSAACVALLSFFVPQGDTAALHPDPASASSSGLSNLSLSLSMSGESDDLQRMEQFLLRTPGRADRCVMFDAKDAAGGRTRDKKHIYRYGKLSAEDKALLYAARPDLDKSGGSCLDDEQEGQGQGQAASPSPSPTADPHDLSTSDNSAGNAAAAGGGEDDEYKEEDERPAVVPDRSQGAAGSGAEAGAGAVGVSPGGQEERKLQERDEGEDDEDEYYDYLLGDYDSDSSDDERPDHEDLTLHLPLLYPQSPPYRRGGAGVL